MNELTTINNTQVLVKEYSGQRVVTFKEIDAVHGRPDGTARRNFNTNKSHLIEGEDYFVRNSYEAQNEFGITAPNGLTLITESGYLMLVKSFTDDLAWKVQRELVNGYFRAKAVNSQFASLSPQLQALISIEMRQQEQERRMDELSSRFEQNAKRMDNLAAAWSAPLASGDNWQESANRAINTIVQHFGLNHQKFRHDIYEELERAAGADLQQRLTRLQNRMAASGATATQRRAVNKLTIVSQDRKLRAIFESILRCRVTELNAARVD